MMMVMVIVVIVMVMVMVMAVVIKFLLLLYLPLIGAINYTCLEFLYIRSKLFSVVPGYYDHISINICF